jgi:hypothetical protein
MAILRDAVTHDSTAGGGADASFTHTPVGTPRGVLLFVTFTGSFAGSTDQIDSTPTYGGVSMTEVAGSPLLFSGTEDKQIHVFHLGSSVPTGPQTVAFSVVDIAAYSTCITYTASGDTEIVDTTTILTTASGNVTGTLSLGGRTCEAAMAFVNGSGLPADTSPLTDWTQQRETDHGSQTSGAYTYDTVGSADVTFGTNEAASTHVAAFGVAIAEVAGGGGSTAAGTATATYTALAIGHTKSKAIGTAVATYTALSIAAGSALAIGTATETDTALPIGSSKSKAIGTATVSYTALTVGFGNRTAVGTATATYSAGSIGHTKAKAIGIATSTHFALRIAVPLDPPISVKTDQVIINYSPKPLPQINKQFDPVTKYLLDELKRMQSTINQLAQATPVVANREPPSPRRGMVRYAIAPWDPLGTAAEGYVVYDGTAWVAL